MQLPGKVVIVTGASSGLGRRFATDLAERGATVVGLARREPLLTALSEQLRRHSPESATLACDVAETESFIEILRKIETRHGRIDILINNAAIGGPSDANADLASYREVMEVNYFAAVAATLAVLPGMMQRREGVIVNVSSDSGRAPGPEEVAYTASKAALSAFSESVAFYAEQGRVRIHALYPGWVPTQMGQGAVDSGMSLPPRSVRRTEEQVSKLLLDRMGQARVDIDATRVARFAPAARALFPGLYRRSVRKVSQNLTTDAT